MLLTQIITMIQLKISPLFAQNVNVISHNCLSYDTLTFIDFEFVLATESLETNLLVINN